MIDRNTRESAMRREEFHSTLQRWLDDSFDSRIGDDATHAGPEWLWVRHGGDHFYLLASSTRPGIREYMRLVVRTGDDADWHSQPTDSSVRDRVVVGEGRQVIEGFELYRHVPRR